MLEFFCILRGYAITFLIMEDTLLYDFCRINIYNQYMVVEINEGVHLTPEHNTVLVNLVDTYYKSRPFVYITNRIHSYTVDASIYIETSKIKNLIGFAVVSQTVSNDAIEAIVNLFKPHPFKVFTDLKTALNWAKALLKNT